MIKYFHGIFQLSLFIWYWLWLTIPPSFANHHTINLTVAYKDVHFTGSSAKAIAVNNQIPGPVLHFKEGDAVTINVHNNLDQGTTIHWHGLLVPWTMDGVEGITQEAILPGNVFSYQFKIKQSGTYWYHAHAGGQEQQGVYGGIIIDPIKTPSYTYSKDYVIVLSDWSDSSPDHILANLKKDGDFYTPNFPLQPSLAQFISDYQKASPNEQKKLVEAYGMMQDMRMSTYDISDVAYDAYLLNGKTKTNPWTGCVHVGDVVRLRFIGAAASTIYRVKIPSTFMQVIHIQGHDVVPYAVKELTIAPGETTDVLVKIDKDTPYLIYGESSDSLGRVYGALVTQQDQKIDEQMINPFPTPEPAMMGHHMMHHEYMQENMKDVSYHNMGSMEHHHAMPTPHLSLTMGTKYQNLKSPVVTNDPDKPVTEIKMALSGYMNHYQWFINNIPEYEADPILIEPGKRYRLTFTNDTMMHHPMHIHGHFFILRNGNGAYDPLLHTIEVPPGATVVADFDADAEKGQWFFHCHHLYHMMSGMARVFRYTTPLKDDQKKSQLLQHPIAHHPHLQYAVFLDIGYDPHHNVQKGSLNILVGYDKHKLQLYSEDAEIKKGKVENADLDIFYWNLISEFWMVKLGANYTYRPAHHPYLQPGIGIEGLWPYFIYTNLRAYLHHKTIKFDLQISRDTQLAHNIYLKTGLRSVFATRTNQHNQLAQGLNYVEYIVKPSITLTPSVSFYTEFNFTQNYSKLKHLLHKEKKSTKETLLLVGVSFVL